MSKKVLFTFPFALILNIGLNAQSWVGKMLDPASNFYDVQHEFKADMQYLQDSLAEDSEEENSIMLYKRWEEFTEPRVYPSGKMMDPSFVPQEYARYITQHAQSKTQSVLSNWTLTGPVYQNCVGLVNFVRLHPTDTNIVFAGSGSGGLWRSADKGAHWTTNTDNLGCLNMSDMAFDPKDPNIIYLASGGSGYAIGLVKSIDGGVSWKPTGLNNLKLSSVIVNPVNSQILLASSLNDVYRSTDGGASFSHILSGTLMRNLMFKPGDPNTVYITSWNTFYRSTDGGLNFTAITSGLPPPGDLIRMSIATTAADPNYVYLLASSLASSTFYGLYLSTDAGLTFTLQSSTPNIVGSQGWFALAIAASPVNKTEVLVGGLNIYRSVNSGKAWTQISSWSVPSMTGAVHVDIHDLQYYNGTTIYAACDGGVFRTANSGVAWTNLCAGLQVTQSYSVGISQINPNLILIGTQDNGTKSFNGAAWSHKIGGDGSICFIDWSNDTFQYASLPSGWLAASVDAGAIFNTIGGSITESTNAYTIPWLQDPDSAATLYAGYTNVWKSTNRGSTWKKISAFTGGGVKVIAVCSGNNRCLCAVNSNKLYRTIDGGTSWINITGTLPVASAVISDVVIRDADSNKIWVAFSGTSNGNKVFETSDGGKTWNNISGTLPNLPATALVYQQNSHDALYLAMDIGVYYRDTLLNSWEPFNTNLPNVVIRQLKIQRSAKKLVASSYGRGIWQSDLYFNTSTGVASKVKSNNNNSLEIFPNPANGEITVSFFAASKGNYRLEIENMLGQLIYLDELNNFEGACERKFNADLKMKGMFLVSLTNLTDNEKTVKKVILY
jgi:photosystem II stability/assembly factor-like uncharacterized protein